MAVRIVGGRQVRRTRAPSRTGGGSGSPIIRKTPTLRVVGGKTYYSGDWSATRTGAPPAGAISAEGKTYGTEVIGGKTYTFVISKDATEAERQQALQEALRAEQRVAVTPTPIPTEEERLAPRVEPAIAPAMISEYKPRTKEELEAEQAERKRIEKKLMYQRIQERTAEYIDRLGGTTLAERVPGIVMGIVQKRPTPEEAEKELEPGLFRRKVDIFGTRITRPEETMIYREPRLEEVSPKARLLQRRKEKEQEERSKLEMEARQKNKELTEEHSEIAQRKYNKLYSDFKIKVERGSVTVEDANRKLVEAGDKILEEERVKAEKKAKQWLSPKIKEYEKDFGKREAQRVKTYELEQSKHYIASNLVGGAVFGAMTMIPVVGPAIFGLGVAKMGIEAPKTIEYAREHPLAFGYQAGTGLLGFVLGRAGVSALRGAITRGIKPTVSQSLSIDKAIRIRDLGRGISLWKVKGAIKTIVKNPKTGKVLSKTRTIVSSDVEALTKAGAIKSYIQSRATSIRESLRTKVKVKFTRDKAVGEFKLKSADVERLYAGGGELFIQQYAKGWISPKKIFVKYKPGEVYRGLVSEWVKAGKPKDVTKFLGKRHGYDVYLTGRESKIIYSGLVDLYKGKELTAIQRGKIHGVAKAFIPDITKTVPGVGAGEWFVRLKPLPKKPIVKVPDILKDITKVRKVTRPRVITKVPKVKPEEVARVTARAVTKGIAEKIIYETPRIKPKLHLIQSSLLGTMIKPEARITEQMRLSTELISGTKEIQISKQQLKLQQKTFASLMTGVVPVEALAVKQKQATKLGLIQVQQLIAPGIGIPTPTPIIVTPKLPPSPGLLIKPRLAEIFYRRRIPTKVKRKAPLRRYQPSIGSVAIGWSEPKAYIRRIEKMISGFELRPMIRREPSIDKRYLQYQQEALIAPSYYRRSPREKARLVAQQRELNRRMRLYAKYPKAMLQKQQLERTFRFMPIRGREKKAMLKLVKEKKTYMPKRVRGRVKLDILGTIPLTKRGAKEARKYNKRISKMLGYTAPKKATKTKTKTVSIAPTKTDDYTAKLNKLLIG